MTKDQPDKDRAEGGYRRVACRLVGIRPPTAAQLAFAAAAGITLPLTPTWHTLQAAADRKLVALAVSAQVKDATANKPNPIVFTSVELLDQQNPNLGGEEIWATRQAKALYWTGQWVHGARCLNCLRAFNYFHRFRRGRPPVHCSRACVDQANRTVLDAEAKALAVGDDPEAATRHERWAMCTVCFTGFLDATPRHSSLSRPLMPRTTCPPPWIDYVAPKETFEEITARRRAGEKAPRSFNKREVKRARAQHTSQSPLLRSASPCADSDEAARRARSEKMDTARLRTMAKISWYHLAKNLGYTIPELTGDKAREQADWLALNQLSDYLYLLRRDRRTFRNAQGVRGVPGVRNRESEVERWAAHLRDCVDPNTGIPIDDCRNARWQEAHDYPESILDVVNGRRPMWEDQPGKPARVHTRTAPDHHDKERGVYALRNVRLGAIYRTQHPGETAKSALSRTWTWFLEARAKEAENRENQERREAETLEHRQDAAAGAREAKVRKKTRKTLARERRAANAAEKKAGLRDHQNRLIAALDPEGQDSR